MHPFHNTQILLWVRKRIPLVRPFAIAKHCIPLVSPSACQVQRNVNLSLCEPAPIVKARFHPLRLLRDTGVRAMIEEVAEDEEP